MLARMRSGIGAITAILMMVLAIWMWTRAQDLALVLAIDPAHPPFEILAVRCCAVAIMAATQWLLLTGVVSSFYDESAADELLRLLLGFVASAALLGAFGLAVAGR